MKKKAWMTAVLLSLTLLLTLLGSGAHASGSVLIEDDAKLLSIVQEENLLKIMERIQPYGHVILLTSANTPSSTSFRNAAGSLYKKRFGSDSGVLFLIDIKNRQVCLWCDGEIFQTVTSAECDNITDNVYRYAKAGKYYACATRAFEQVYQLLSGREIARPMKLICNLLLALSLSALVISLILQRYEYNPFSTRKWSKRRESISQISRFDLDTHPETLRIFKEKWQSPRQTEKDQNRQWGKNYKAAEANSVYDIRNAMLTHITSVQEEKNTPGGGGGSGGGGGGGSGGGGFHGF